MAWPLTGSALTKYNRLLSDLRQYGDFIFVGAPDDITWLQETIIAASDGALRPSLDDVANRSHYWMLELSRVLGEKVVVCPECPECPPVIPCPPCPPCPDPLYTTTPPDMEDEFGLFFSGDIPGLTGVVRHGTNFGLGVDIQNQTTLTSFSAPDLVTLAGVNIKFDNNPALTSLSLPALTTLDNTASVQVYNSLALTSLSLPALATMDNTASVQFTDTAALTSFSLPALTIMDNAAFIQGFNNSALTSFSLPALATVDNGAFVQAYDNPALTTVSLGSAIVGNGTALDFFGNALTDVSVNHVLARGVASALFVSGLVELSGGTNAAPTGQGIVDKADLITRGVTVNTN